MPQKIFISYRRQDSAANMLGIGQYLEHEFGRKNVFIDVDMRAGAKFPTVLRQRLAECKVMLVLVGPEWLNACDENGTRRLDNPDDWVRLEIAFALKQNVTVIPVRINGAELPAKTMLPEDIRGLLDHQAMSVSVAGFRHEMAGLAKDIRSIPSPRPWKRIVSVAVGVIIVGALAAVATTPVRNILERGLHLGFLQISQTPDQIRKSDPGKWVMFAIDKLPVAYYFDPASVKTVGDEVTYTARFPLKSANASASAAPQGAYQDQTDVIECKKSISFTLERTIYDKTGLIIYHLKKPAPETLDLSNSDTVRPGTIIFLAKLGLCSGQLQIPIVSKDQLAKMPFSYLSGTSDGDTYYARTETKSDVPYQKRAIFIVKFYGDHSFADLPGQNILGLPSTYRGYAEPVQFDCKQTKVQIEKDDYFDQDNNWVRVVLPTSSQTLDAPQGSAFRTLLQIACGVTGTYEGNTSTTYKTGALGEQKMSMFVEQNGNDINVSYRTTSGGEGTGVGKLTGASVKSISLRSTAQAVLARMRLRSIFPPIRLVGPTKGRTAADRWRVTAPERGLPAKSRCAFPQNWVLYISVYDARYRSLMSAAYRVEFP